MAETLTNLVNSIKFKKSNKSKSENDPIHDSQPWSVEEEEAFFEVKKLLYNRWCQFMGVIIASFKATSPTVAVVNSKENLNIWWVKGRDSYKEFRKEEVILEGRIILTSSTLMMKWLIHLRNRIVVVGLIMRKNIDHIISPTLTIILQKNIKEFMGS